MKIRPVGVELYVEELTDRQTDMTKLIVAFRSLTNASKSTLKPESFHINYLTDIDRANIVTVSLYLKNL